MIAVRPLEGGLGVELDLDLSQPLAAEDERRVIDLFLERHLLLIRHPGLTHEEQCRFASNFCAFLLCTFFFMPASSGLPSFMDDASSKSDTFASCRNEGSGLKRR